MKMGFDSEGEKEKQTGNADTSSDYEGFTGWISQIMLDFSIAYGVFSFLRDVLNQFRRRSY